MALGVSIESVFTEFVKYNPGRYLEVPHSRTLDPMIVQHQTLPEFPIKVSRALFVRFTPPSDHTEIFVLEAHAKPLRWLARSLDIG